MDKKQLLSHIMDCAEELRRTGVLNDMLGAIILYATADAMRHGHDLQPLFKEFLELKVIPSDTVATDGMCCANTILTTVRDAVSRNVDLGELARCARMFEATLRTPETVQ